MSGHRDYPIHRYILDQGWSTLEDHVSVEEPLEIRLLAGPEGQREERQLAITMRTPGQDADLIRGFLYSESIIPDASAIRKLHTKTNRRLDRIEHTVVVELVPDVHVHWDQLERHFLRNASCGICGQASIEAALATPHPTLFPFTPRITPDTIRHLPRCLRDRQSLFQTTGSIHASGLCDGQGNLFFVREDVGRHNAMDKLVGAMLLQDVDPASRAVAILSGRASFELVQKAIRAGIPILVAVGAPSSLAIDLANDAGLTLIGFTEEERFNVYCGHQRLAAS